VKSDLAASELRGKDGTTSLEVRLGGKLDKLSDQFGTLAERISRMEGERAAKPPEP
jgi:hypothetical protein